MVFSIIIPTEPFSTTKKKKGLETGWNVAPIKNWPKLKKPMLPPLFIQALHWTAIADHPLAYDNVADHVTNIHGGDVSHDVRLANEAEVNCQLSNM